MLQRTKELKDTENISVIIYIFYSISWFIAKVCVIQKALTKVKEILFECEISRLLARSRYSRYNNDDYPQDPF